jgi:hypothetical protein
MVPGDFFFILLFFVEDEQINIYKIDGENKIDS